MFGNLIDMAKKTGWGGVRKGAGRPPLPKDERRETRTFYLRTELLRWLEERARADGVTISEIAEPFLERARKRSK